MSTSSKVIALLALAALAAALYLPGGASASAQTPVTPTTAAYYQAVDGATSSSGSERLTIQNVAAGKKIAVLQSVSVDCSIVCNATIYQNGTAPTGTLLTPNTINSGVVGIPLSPASLVYSASNAGNGGWAHPPAFPILAGSTYLIDLSKFFMDYSSGSQNLSIAIGWSGSNTYALKITWEEQ